MTKLEELEEVVAATKREVAVAEALATEYRRKQQMAEEEVSLANRRLDEARLALEAAIADRHDAVHGKPVSFDDRMEFEKRWDARLEERQKRYAEREAKRKATQGILDELDARVDGQIVSAEVVRTNLGF